MDGDHKLLELVEKDRLDEILHGFTRITGVSSFIVSPDGKPISQEYNWSRLCSDFCRSTEKGKQLCYKSDRHGAEMSARLKRRVCYTCLNAGLVDCTSPIIVGNYHIASVMCGQVLNRPIDKSAARKHAESIGIENIDEYFHALRNVPIISHERLDTIVDFMETVTKTISELAWNKYVTSKQSQRYLDRLVNRISDGIISIDTGGKISMVNDAFANAIGFSKNRIIGQYFSEYISGKDSLAAYRKILQLVDQKGHGRASITLAGDGDRKIDAQVSFDKDGQGVENSSYVAVLRDVSEEKRIESLKEDLIGMMTHDLRNPIFSIRKALQLLGSGLLGPLNARQGELIKLSEKTSSQLSSMVMDYLDIYRHENGKLRLRKELLDIRSIIRESVKQIELIAEEKQVSIRYDPPNEELNVMGDRMRLIRICLNLLANAVNFSPIGGIIDIGTRYVDGDELIRDAGPDQPGLRIPPAPLNQRYAITQISDQGPGIERGFETTIFDKFTTLRHSDVNNRCGIGLGLAFCKLAVEAHRGCIGVRSPVVQDKTGKGSGSCFYFALPSDVKVRFDAIGMEF